MLTAVTDQKQTLLALQGHFGSQQLITLAYSVIYILYKNRSQISCHISLAIFLTGIEKMRLQWNTNKGFDIHDMTTQ